MHIYSLVVYFNPSLYIPDQLYKKKTNHNIIFYLFQIIYLIFVFFY